MSNTLKSRIMGVTTAVLCVLALSVTTAWRTLLIREGRVGALLLVHCVSLAVVATVALVLYRSPAVSWPFAVSLGVLCVAGWLLEDPIGAEATGFYFPLALSRFAWSSLSVGMLVLGALAVAYHRMDG